MKPTQNSKLMFILAFTLSLGVTACGSTGTVTSATTASAASASSSSGAFSVSPSVSEIGDGGTSTLTASGGTAPYYYFVITDGYGSINSTTGVFTANSNASSGTVTFEATDSTGKTAITTITIIGGASSTTSTTSLSISSSSSSITSGSTVTFTVSGGVSPYTYSLLQGAGSLSISGSSSSTSTVYTSSSSETGDIEIEVKDSSGSEVTSIVEVTSAVVNSTQFATSFNLLTDDMIGITLYNPAGSSYPNLVIFGTGSKPNEPSMLAHTTYSNCGSDSSGNALSPCAVTVELSNFQNLNPGTTTYEGTVSFSGRSGTGSISYCINPTVSTSEAYVLPGTMTGSATLTEFLAMSYDDTQAGRKLLNGTEVTSFYSEIDTNSGSGYAYVYVSGAYTSSTTCSSYGSSVITSAD